MAWKRLLPLLTVGLALLAGCGAPAKKQSPIGVGEVPKWVTRPEVEQGIAAAECTVASEDFSTDRREVVARSRRQLSRKLQARVEAVEATYEKRFSGGEPSDGAQPFLSISPELIRQTLEDTEPRKMGYEKFDDQKHFCVVLTLDESEMRDFFSRLTERSGVKVGPETKEILYRTFQSGKTPGSADRN